MKRCLSLSCVFVSCGLLLFSTGCTLLLPARSEKSYYVLDVRICEEAVDPEMEGPVVMLTDVESPVLFGSQRIVFGAGDERQGYKISFWSEPVPRSLLRLAQSALECQKYFSSVELPSSIVHADYQLRLRLVDFYHDTSALPGRAVVRLKVSIVDLSERANVASKDFKVTEELSAEGIEALIGAFNSASEKALTELADWAAQSVAASRRKKR